jgi:phosphate starvation-inducible membrane PsiE
MKTIISFFNMFQKILSFCLLMFAFAFIALNTKEYFIYHRLIFQKSQNLYYYIIFLLGLFFLSVFRHVLLVVSSERAKIGGRLK